MKRLMWEHDTSLVTDPLPPSIRHKIARLRIFLREQGLLSLAQAILIVLFISSPVNATADFAIVNHTTKQIAWVRDYGGGGHYIPIGWETAGEDRAVNRYTNELGYTETGFTYQVETLGLVLVLGLGTGIYKMYRKRTVG